VPFHGFPSLAQVHEKETFDFNRIRIQHPAVTVTMSYSGKTLKDYGIFPGDRLIVDCKVCLLWLRKTVNSVLNGLDSLLSLFLVLPPVSSVQE